MAKLVYELNQSLDGYVDHTKFAPDPVLFRHFVELTKSVSAMVYGGRMYEIMRYWDEETHEWDAAERDYASAWRSVPKWVVSKTLTSVGPNATLVAEDFEAVVRKLKADLSGEIEIAGPVLAQFFTELGLIDEYRIYLHPVVLGDGKPFFIGPRPPLRFSASDRISENVVRLTYVPN